VDGGTYNPSDYLAWDHILMTHKTDGKSKYRSSYDALTHIHDYNIDIDKREIYLFGREETKSGTNDGDDITSEPGVDFMMANQFIKNIRILQSVSSDPILIHMKTCGGMWTEGMAIYDAIKACPNYVVILNYTHARSMSSIILQAADWRAMMPYSTFMFHQGTQGFEGTKTQFQTEYEQTQISVRQMLDIYAGSMTESVLHGKKSPAQRRKWLSDKMLKHEDVYLSAQEAIDHGFADQVFGKDNSYDWSALRVKGA